MTSEIPVLPDGWESSVFIDPPMWALQPPTLVHGTATSTSVWERPFLSGGARLTVRRSDLLDHATLALMQGAEHYELSVGSLSLVLHGFGGLQELIDDLGALQASVVAEAGARRV